MTAWSLLSWRRRRRERAASQEHRLDINWDEFIDGRARVLKRGREYEAEIGDVMDTATAAAARRGMVARVVPEHFPRMRYFESYVWIQFADYEIDADQPCPCGEPNPIKFHPSFARCHACGVRLIVKRPKGSKFGRRPGGDDRDAWSDDGSAPQEENEESLGAGAGPKAGEGGVIRRIFRRGPARSTSIPARSAEVTGEKGSGVKAKGSGAKARRLGGKAKGRGAKPKRSRAKGKRRGLGAKGSGAAVKGRSEGRKRGGARQGMGKRARGGG